MQKTNEMRDRLTAEFAENYMEKLFYFCLKKTGSHTEAEDLTQDIALQIITALNKGRIPTSFSAWVWQIARNRYSVWATEKHNRNESVTGSDIGDYEIEDESENILDEMIDTEQVALLRRELAFIKSDYRNIVVAYYIENKSVRDIASSLSISVSAVQQRLHRICGKRERFCNFTNVFVFDVIGNDDVTIITLNECQLAPEQSHLLCTYHFIKDIFAFVFDLIIADIGTGYRFVSIMLFFSPYRITITRNLPYPRRKTCWNCTIVQSRNNLKRDILCQFFRFNVAAGLLQTEVKQLLHIIFGKLTRKPITHDLRFLHFLASFHTYSVAFLNLGALIYKIIS